MLKLLGTALSSGVHVVVVKICLLCCAVMCCAVLCCDVLCCDVLCCDPPSYFSLSRFDLALACHVLLCG